MTRRRTPAPVRTVATYLRISKDTEASTSIEKQRANVARLIADRWPGAVVTEFMDRGVSATSMKARPKFTELASRLSEFDVVAFDKQDRVARRPLDFWTFAAAAEAANTSIVGASEDLDLSTADGEMTAGIRLTVARAEARRTGDRIRATNDYRRTLGIGASGGPVTWGLIREGDHFAPDPERAAILLDIIARVIAGTMGARSMAEEMTARGIPTARGHAVWSHRAASKILHSPALAGMAVYGDDVIRGLDGMPSIAGTPLITVARWHALQTALQARNNQRTSTHPRQAPALLHGIAHDDQGHRLYRQDASGRPTRYTCRAVGCPSQTSIGADSLNGFVVASVLDVVGDSPEMVLKVITPGRDVARVSSLRAEIARTVQALTLARDGDTIADLAGRLTALRASEDEADIAAAHGGLYGFTRTGRTIAEAYAAADDDAGRRLILADHVTSVTVLPGRRGGGKPDTALRVRIEWLADDPRDDSEVVA